MLEVIGKGKTLEAATEHALKQLGVTREEVEIEPLSAGVRGFLGIGSKPAEVRAVLKNGGNGAVVNSFMKNLLGHIGIQTELNVNEEDEEVIITLGEEASPLIGHHGQTLDALQYLISRVVNGEKEDWKKILLDIDNYRERRDENLKEMALNLAKKVVDTQKDAKTQPLSGAERRVVHMTLKENTEITTFSIGSGDKKRVVIALNNRENGRSDRSGDRKPNRGGKGRGGNRGGGGGNRSGGNRGGRGGRGRGGNRGGGKGNKEQRPAASAKSND